MTPRPAPRPSRFLAALLFSFGLAAASPADAQNAPVTLVADSVIVESETVLIAEGSVEVFSEGRRLSATRLVYDQESDTLSVEGPITLTDGPDTLVVADAAELSADLRDGIIEGVRVILDQQVQIAASSAQRQQGRFTDLRDTVATSCEVCTPGETPLWHIRARRIIHDEERKRIYFEHAQFRILDIPVAYLPAISTPEPSVRRARGFLVPSTKTSDLYGTGLRLPYFVPLGEHADLTFAPFVATDLNGSYTRTLEARYRQAFTSGNIEFNGAISEDSIEDDGMRGYLFGEGRFDLPYQTTLTFGIQFASDDAYLSDYDFSDADRLENRIGLSRIVGDSRAEANVIVYHSLRDDEDNNTIPTLVGDARYDERMQVPGLPGFVDFTVIGQGHRRISSEDIVGRDMAQGRALLSWGNAVTVGPGIRLTADARAMADVQHVVEDSRYESYQAALTPSMSLAANLPMKKTGANGVSYLLEPMAQVVWVGPYDIDSPNDDSTQPAFDLGNLMGYQRYPGLDRVEDGLRANLALRWQRFAPSGWTVGLTTGRVVRAESADFSPGTGLGGTRSDWLAQVDLDYKGMTLRSLTLIGDEGDLTLNETRVGYVNTRFDLTAGYVWQIEDEALNQDEDLSELTLDGSYQITDRWEAQMALRRDLIAERSTRAGFGLTYRNDCVRVDLSGVRRFRSTEDAEPTYSYGLTVSLTGFGTGGTASSPRTGRCS
ncbi:LPS-assembly protein LptD [Poseidonocella sp. HB161398]|uniref:LPS-assembly protein LptD n=1 Tax=Poseidonocella sp. HB161398 TaxID=2320855 RepID=UPI001107BF8C|nr:LPS assembly protein LptD [Poseidonocella sp. HB161398]